MQSLDFDLRTTFCLGFRQLSLSTNTIDKLPAFPALNNLRILSIGRNSIKSLAGLELLVNLEELWCSYNQIERLNGIEGLVKLKVVRAGNNRIAAWDGIKSLVRSKEFSENFGRITHQRPLVKSSLPVLEEVTLVGNPLEESHANKQEWRDEVSIRFPTVKKVEGKMIIRDENGKPVHGKEEAQSAPVPTGTPSTPDQGSIAASTGSESPKKEGKSSKITTPSKGSRASTAKGKEATKKKK